MQIYHGNMYEMVPLHKSAHAFRYLISICSKNLAIMKFEFHALIIKHLSEHVSLEEIYKTKRAFAKLDLNPIHLHFLLDFTNDFLKTVFTWTHHNFILFISIVITNINHFYPDCFLLADLHGLIRN